jgi:4-hydroxybenzoate polyprenyltransferase
MNFKAASQFIRNEFIYGGHLLSAGAVGIVFTAAILLDIKITWDFVLIVYLLTYIAYSYNRFMELRGDSLTNSSRTNHINKYARIFPHLLFISFVLLFCLLIIFGNINSVIFGFIMIIGGILYTNLFKKLTDKIVGFKSLYVSLVWASLVIFLGIYYNISLDLAILLFFIFVFLRWIINTSFCDLKDIEEDRKEGLRTFVVVFGGRQWLKYLLLLNILTAIPIIQGVYLRLFPFYSIFVLVSIPYVFYYFIRLKKDPQRVNYFSDVFADAEFILWPIFVIIGRIIL